MKEVKMFNHGIFQMKLQEKLEEINNKKKVEKDPYKQWNLLEQIKLCEELLTIYKNTTREQL